MTQLTITRKNFLDWYFNYGQDQENEENKIDLADSIINQLFKTGTAIYSVGELFDNTNHDAIRFCFTNECKDEDNDQEIGDLFNNYKITLK